MRRSNQERSLVSRTGTVRRCVMAADGNTGRNGDATVDTANGDVLQLPSMKKTLITDHGRGKGVTLAGTRLTMADVARLSGVTTGHVSRVLRKKQAASPEVLARMAKALKLSAKTLAAMIEEQNP